MASRLPGGCEALPATTVAEPPFLSPAAEGCTVRWPVGALPTRARGDPNGTSHAHEAGHRGAHQRRHPVHGHARDRREKRRRVLEHALARDIPATGGLLALAARELDRQKRARGRLPAGWVDGLSWAIVAARPGEL